ncbi:MAG: zinc dependent phospholipase C family protein [Syntrophomonadaceae bacterium]|nr:zinc dependent phospholipase C family protein [Syntrophomonadaceae bacterium]
MWTQTHLLIGSTIGQLITDQSMNHLDFKAFRYGCIIPDFHPNYMTISHCKHESFNLVAALIGQAVRCSPDYHPTSRDSVRLGIITHFISDYFCQAHNYCEFASLVSHLKYEGRLHEEFKKAGLTKLCGNMLGGSQIAELHSLEDLPKFILKRHCEYLQERRNLQTDLVYCLNVATVVAMVVLEHSSTAALQRCA